MAQYASISDLYLYGFREEARGDLADAVLNAHLAAASTKVDGFLGQRFGRPLATWTDEVTMWVCSIALYTIMTGPRGIGAESPDYTTLKDRHDDAIRMLGKAQRQDYHPVGLVPVTAPPGTSATQPLVIKRVTVDTMGGTGTSRGW